MDDTYRTDGPSLSAAALNTPSRTQLACFALDPEKHASGLSRSTSSTSTSAAHGLHLSNAVNAISMMFSQGEGGRGVGQTLCIIYNSLSDM